MVNSYHNLTSHPPSLHHRGIFHDETVYPDSHAFNPGRFLTEDGKIDPSVPDPEQRVFGSGRRLVLTVSTKSPCFLTGITTGFARVDSSQSRLCLSPLRGFLPSSTFYLRWMRTGGLGFPWRSSRKTLSGTQKRHIPRYHNQSILFYPILFEQPSCAVRLHRETSIREVGDAYRGGVGEVFIR